MRLLVPAIVLASSPAWAADFATCIIDKAPGAANDVAATAMWKVCLAEHPGGLDAVKQGSGRGFLSFKTGDECTAKKAGDTRSQRAAIMISNSCRRLYDGFNFFDQFDAPRR